ncbi:ABC transporter ATP-binding protein [Mycoplasmatota bacterium]|nr:ABC transporter ATP-binding protein [Mycoplasmatota bacterium]
MVKYEITTKGLAKHFGKFTAVDQINLKISKGSIHGIVGPNGAGKTTTIKMLIGAMIPTSGTGLIGNHEIGTMQSRQMIGYVPEKATFYKDLNAIEYLIYMGQLSGLTLENAIKRAHDVLKLFELIPFMYKKPTAFSSGMKKKLTIAQSLMHKPEILILDEPTANLDPETRMFIINILKRLVKEENMTVFISSHILTELELVVDEVSLIDKGNIVLTGKIDEIKRRFNQGVIEIETDNNHSLKRTLDKLNYIDETKIDEKKLKVYTKEVDLFKKEIGKIIYDLGLMIHALNEEKITLDNIYQNVFIKGKEDDKL